MRKESFDEWGERQYRNERRQQRLICVGLAGLVLFALLVIAACQYFWANP